MTAQSLIFTKEEVLKAIETEDLLPGAFAENNGFCSVCAVGSLLRNLLPGTNLSSINELGTSMVTVAVVFRPQERFPAYQRALERALGRRDYLSAISIAFEGICDGERQGDKNPNYVYPMDRIRRNLRALLIKDLPDVIEIKLLDPEDFDDDITKLIIAMTEKNPEGSK